MRVDPHIAECSFGHLCCMSLAALAVCALCLFVLL